MNTHPFSFDVFTAHTLPALLRTNKTMQYHLVTTGKVQGCSTGLMPTLRHRMYIWASEYAPNPLLLLIQSFASFGNMSLKAGITAQRTVIHERTQQLKKQFASAEHTLQKIPDTHNIFFIYAHGNEVEAVCECVRSHNAKYPETYMVLLCETSAYAENEARLQLLIDQGILAGLVVSEDADGRYVMRDVFDRLLQTTH